MSADNGYTVTRLYRPNESYPLSYGVFYYFASDDDRPAEYYIRDNAVDRREFANPVEAIMFGHECDSQKYTEYGVTVNSTVLLDARAFRGCQ